MIAGIEISALGNKTTGTSRYITCLVKQLKTFDDEIKSFSAFNSKSISLIKKRGVQKFIYRNFYLKKEMTKQKVDYAFFPDYFMPPDFSIPSAIVIHDLSFLSHPYFYSGSFVSFYKYQLKRTLKNKPLIMTISENTRAAIEKYIGIKKENVHLLQAYSEFGSNNNERTRENYLLYVGHIEPRKNLYFLIKTFLRWKETTKADMKLVIAGEFWIKNDETEKVFSEFGNHPDVEFTGYVDEENLKELYRKASGFVHTSFEEGFCFPVLEAMHYQLPVVCSFNTGAEEISKPNSIIINPYSEKSLLTGFDKLNGIISSGRKVEYKIKYSSSLMREQLAAAIDILKSKAGNKICVPIIAAENKEEAVEKTLLYSELFNSGIKKDFLHKSVFDIEVSKEELERILLKLYFRNKIYFKNDSVFLNYSPSVIYKTKVKPDRVKNKLALRIIDFIPFISSVSLSGGTVHYGYEDHNDIDLFIITKPNTLYIVYALIHVLSLIFRVRKELCANYLIDERGMEIKYPHDFYTAHQIMSLRAIKNKKQLNSFFSQNKWIIKYFLNFSWDESEINKHSGNIFLIPLNKALKFLYRIIYRRQLKENLNKTSIILDNISIKLHTNDNRLRITEEFSKAWKDYKSGVLTFPESEHFNERNVV